VKLREIYDRDKLRDGRESTILWSLIWVFDAKETRYGGPVHRIVPGEVYLDTTNHSIGMKVKGYHQPVERNREASPGTDEGVNPGDGA
jgi:hypothetical protein